MTSSSPLSCPYFSATSSCKECEKVERQWTVANLIEDLSKTKSQHLTKSEICWLRLLIYGLSPEEIAQKLSISNSHVKSALSNSIYRYVESLTGRNIKKYSQVRLYLQETEEYEKVQFELVISKGVKMSDVNPERLKYIVKKLGIPFPVDFTNLQLEEEETDES